MTSDTRFVLRAIALLVTAASLGNAGDQGPIASGETRNGELTGPSFMDSWTFTGTAGDRVVINAVVTSGAANTFIDLYPPGGGAEEATTYPFGDQLDHQLAQTGEYTILVQDYQLDHPGTYTITFLAIPGAVSSASDPDGGPLASGQTLSAVTDAASDLDAFQFYGAAGGRVIINTVVTSGAANTFIDLYPPGGGAEEATTYPFGDQLDHQLALTGVYTAVVQDYQFDHTGTYNTTLLLIPGAVSSPGDPDGGAIAPGQTLDGEIDSASDLDAFQLYGNAGDRVIVNTVVTSGSSNTYMDLFPAGGSPKEATTYPFGDQLDYQLAQTGLYTVIVQDYQLDHTGSYDISLTKIPSTLRPGLYNPSPPVGGVITDLSGAFAWDPVSGADEYDLYLGTDVVEPLVLTGDGLPSVGMDIPPLVSDETYYWRVIAHTAGGDVDGPVWWFSTDFGIFADGFETGSTSAWSLSLP